MQNGGGDERLPRGFVWSLVRHRERLLLAKRGAGRRRGTCSGDGRLVLKRGAGRVLNSHAERICRAGAFGCRPVVGVRERRGESGRTGAGDRDRLSIQECCRAEILKGHFGPDGQRVGCGDRQRRSRRDDLHAGDRFLGNVEIRGRRPADPDGVSIRISVIQFGHSYEAACAARHGRRNRAEII